MGILRIGRLAVLVDVDEPMVKRVGAVAPLAEGNGVGAPKGEDGVEDPAAPKVNPPVGRLVFTAAGEAGWLPPPNWNEVLGAMAGAGEPKPKG